MGNNCRYDQECSEYYINSLKQHGLLSGSLLGVKRVLTCHPIKILGGGSSYNYAPSKKELKKDLTKFKKSHQFILNYSCEYFSFKT